MSNPTTNDLIFCVAAICGMIDDEGVVCGCVFLGTQHLSLELYALNQLPVPKTQHFPPAIPDSRSSP